MSKTRKNYSAEFKAKVISELFRGEKSFKRAVYSVSDRTDDAIELA